MDLKNLHIGSMIKEKVTKSDIEIHRICKFLNCSEEDIIKMYESPGIGTELLLRWSKLLQYDFFRLYSQHLILYSPQSSMDYIQKKKTDNLLPDFRKSLYTKEIVEFVLQKIRKGEMTKSSVISEYKIPKSTLYKWLHKYDMINK
ncbi:transposase [Chryseobacterium elymi]|uniref:Transposase n=1 Tax=Chryseobacterium elymi TaxID=395936 RepID=A0A3D9DEQ9_9FLAO|nr:transposase [Chryseobacterium elymi]REC76495.1 transposase [Chryseobacterium elymi]